MDQEVGHWRPSPVEVPPLSDDAEREFTAAAWKAWGIGGKAGDGTVIDKSPAP